MGFDFLPDVGGVAGSSELLYKSGAVLDDANAVVDDIGLMMSSAGSTSSDSTSCLASNSPRRLRAAEILSLALANGGLSQLQLPASQGRTSSESITCRSEEAFANCYDTKKRIWKGGPPKQVGDGDDEVASSLRCEACRQAVLVCERRVSLHSLGRQFGAQQLRGVDEKMNTLTHHQALYFTQYQSAGSFVPHLFDVLTFVPDPTTLADGRSVGAITDPFSRQNLVAKYLSTVFLSPIARALEEAHDGEDGRGRGGQILRAGALRYLRASEENRFAFVADRLEIATVFCGRPSLAVDRELHYMEYKICGGIYLALPPAQLLQHSSLAHRNKCAAFVRAAVTDAFFAVDEFGGNSVVGGKSEEGLVLSTADGTSLGWRRQKFWHQIFGGQGDENSFKLVPRMRNAERPGAGSLVGGAGSLLYSLEFSEGTDKSQTQNPFFGGPLKTTTRRCTREDFDGEEGPAVYASTRYGGSRGWWRPLTHHENDSNNWPGKCSHSDRGNAADPGYWFAKFKDGKRHKVKRVRLWNRSNYRHRLDGACVRFATDGSKPSNADPANNCDIYLPAISGNSGPGSGTEVAIERWITGMMFITTSNDYYMTICGIEIFEDIEATTTTPAGSARIGSAFEVDKIEDETPLGTSRALQRSDGGDTVTPQLQLVSAPLYAPADNVLQASAGQPMAITNADTCSALEGVGLGDGDGDGDGIASASSHKHLFRVERAFVGDSAGPWLRIESVAAERSSMKYLAKTKAGTATLGDFSDAAGEGRAAFYVRTSHFEGTSSPTTPALSQMVRSQGATTHIPLSGELSRPEDRTLSSFFRSLSSSMVNANGNMVRPFLVLHPDDSSRGFVRGAPRTSSGATTTASACVYWDAVTADFSRAAWSFTAPHSAGDIQIEALSGDAAAACQLQFSFDAMGRAARLGCRGAAGTDSLRSFWRASAGPGPRRTASNNRGRGGPGAGTGSGSGTTQILSFRPAADFSPEAQAEDEPQTANPSEATTMLNRSGIDGVCPLRGIADKILDQAGQERKVERCGPQFEHRVCGKATDSGAPQNCDESAGICNTDETTSKTSTTTSHWLKLISLFKKNENTGPARSYDSVSVPAHCETEQENGDGERPFKQGQPWKNKPTGEARTSDTTSSAYPVLSARLLPLTFFPDRQYYLCSEFLGVAKQACAQRDLRNAAFVTVSRTRGKFDRKPVQQAVLARGAPSGAQAAGAHWFLRPMLSADAEVLYFVENENDPDMVLSAETLDGSSGDGSAIGITVGKVQRGGDGVLKSLWRAHEVVRQGVGSESVSGGRNTLVVALESAVHRGRFLQAPRRLGRSLTLSRNARDLGPEAGAVGRGATLRTRLPSQDEAEDEDEEDDNSDSGRLTNDNENDETEMEVEMNGNDRGPDAGIRTSAAAPLPYVPRLQTWSVFPVRFDQDNLRLDANRYLEPQQSLRPNAEYELFTHADEGDRDVADLRRALFGTMTSFDNSAGTTAEDLLRASASANALTPIMTNPFVPLAMRNAVRKATELAAAQKGKSSVAAQLRDLVAVKHTAHFISADLKARPRGHRLSIPFTVEPPSFGGLGMKFRNRADGSYLAVDGNSCAVTFAKDHRGPTTDAAAEEAARIWFLRAPTPVAVKAGLFSLQNAFAASTATEDDSPCSLRSFLSWNAATEKLELDVSESMLWSMKEVHLDYARARVVQEQESAQEGDARNARRWFGFGAGRNVASGLGLLAASRATTSTPSLKRKSKMTAGGSFMQTGEGDAAAEAVTSSPAHLVTVTEETTGRAETMTQQKQDHDHEDELANAVNVVPVFPGAAINRPRHDHDQQEQAQPHQQAPAVAQVRLQQEGESPPPSRANDFHLGAFGLSVHPHILAAAEYLKLAICVLLILLLLGLIAHFIRKHWSCGRDSTPVVREYRVTRVAGAFSSCAQRDQDEDAYSGEHGASDLPIAVMLQSSSALLQRGDDERRPVKIHPLSASGGSPGNVGPDESYHGRFGSYGAIDTSSSSPEVTGNDLQQGLGRDVSSAVGGSPGSSFQTTSEEEDEAVENIILRSAEARRS
eukprot:g375.t1